MTIYISRGGHLQGCAKAQCVRHNTEDTAERYSLLSLAPVLRHRSLHKGEMSFCHDTASMFPSHLLCLSASGCLVFLCARVHSGATIAVHALFPKLPLSYQFALCFRLRNLSDLRRYSSSLLYCLATSKEFRCLLPLFIFVTP